MNPNIRITPSGEGYKAEVNVRNKFYPIYFDEVEASRQALYRKMNQMTEEGKFKRSSTSKVTQTVESFTELDPYKLALAEFQGHYLFTDEQEALEIATKVLERELTEQK